MVRTGAQALVLTLHSAVLPSGHESVRINPALQRSTKRSDEPESVRINPTLQRSTRRLDEPESVRINPALRRSRAMRVGFFVTCLVDLMRPSIGFAAIRLLQSGGAEVVVPPGQTCCGQLGYNSGDRAGALALARRVVDQFEHCDYLVAPSGSCSGMIK